jgi:hypothetical protein
MDLATNRLSYGAVIITSVYVGLFANDSCVYATDSKEGYVLRPLQIWMQLRCGVSGGTKTKECNI